MPNWTANEITTNDPKIIPTFINEEGDFDFNLLIPMPKELDMTEGSSTEEAIVCFLTNYLTIPVDELPINKIASSGMSCCEIGRVYQRMEKQLEEKTLISDRLNALFKDGKQYISNIYNYGYRTWYYWCTANWGTKWNACETSFDDSAPNFAAFNTAWNAPVPIFERMCEMFPDSEISFVCDYEDGYTEKYENDDGNLTLVERIEHRYDEDEDEDWDEEEDEKDDEGEEE